MKIIYIYTILLLLFPIVASSNDKPECYQKNININEYYPVLTRAMEKMYIEPLETPYFHIEFFN